MKFELFLLKKRRMFFINNMPRISTHWNENDNEICFFLDGGRTLIVKKPLKIKIIEFILFKIIYKITRRF